MNPLEADYRGRRVLITGHTGFKGSWLALALQQLQAQVSGFALPPETHPNHFELLQLTGPSYLGDLRDADRLAQVVRDCQPEIVFHLAAQPLVRRSYREPHETWSTNVIGTLNLLEACRAATGLKALVVITSDKCYENREQSAGYVETDRLGGADPYSASKAATEILVASHRASFFHQPQSPRIATARAGNVIGGGDWSEDRLIADIIRAITQGSSLEIRYPQAIRPWQHVMDAIVGYLLLGVRLMRGEAGFDTAWNFGPAADELCSVQQVLDQFSQYFPQLRWHPTPTQPLHETSILSVNSDQARRRLNWRPCWSIPQAIEKTALWYQAFLDRGQVTSVQQVRDHLAEVTQGPVRGGVS